MTSYPLTIITPDDGKIYDDTVQSLIVPGAEGLMGILARHAPLITALKPGCLTVKTGGKEVYYALDHGILEVTPQGRVLILVDRAVPCRNVEHAKEATRML